MGHRGRKIGASGEQSRALLLEVAAEEFAQKGYFHTKISDIVKRAGLTQPSFYLYFESKDAIFRELVDLFRTRLSELTSNSRVESGLDLPALPERITSGLSAIFKFFMENQNLTRIGFFMASDADEFKEILAGQIESNLLSEQQAGYFREDIDMGTVAESLTGIIERLTLTRLFKGIKAPEDLAKEVVHLFLYGMINKSSNQ
ncbi:TetR family transcriptional regulator [Paenibacillus sp. FSL R5-0490]|uniref:TetR/AcrR family transcriptional regulator n=1 Tax=Paenibacillus sp. FSL R5-0490 TaxID=1920424 RepID=UPI00096EA0D9|nr:TetR/AcrR family transcriptional regulator [Paenibacillus sp. FSL R5-0490]OMF59854.1 TetR family transcriptional regulator [Paenibacillus sp. FSL R5-0490]